jgi:hypothetical protein
MGITAAMIMGGITAAIMAMTTTMMVTGRVITGPATMVVAKVVARLPALDFRRFRRTLLA